MGPAAELEKLKRPMGPLGTKFFALDEGAIFLGESKASELAQDSHVTIVPYFTVPEGKMDAFKAGFADFYKHTKEGTAASGECLYYGFAQEGNKIFCREGYKSADGVLAHLGEVKAELDIAVGLVAMLTRSRRWMTLTRASLSPLSATRKACTSPVTVGRIVPSSGTPTQRLARAECLMLKPLHWRLVQLRGCGALSNLRS